MGFSSKMYNPFLIRDIIYTCRAQIIKVLSVVNDFCLLIIHQKVFSHRLFYHFNMCAGCLFVCLVVFEDFLEIIIS